MLPYVDHLSITVASESHRDNIRRLQRTYTEIADRGRRLGVSFSVPKTELIHQKTPSHRTPHATNPIELHGQPFHPRWVIRWLGYWLTPALTASHHYRHTLSLAQAVFSFVKRLSSPGAGVRPFLCHPVVQVLLLPILTYGADLYTPNSSALWGMNIFWHRVHRWTTNAFYSTPTSILSREVCLPPLSPTADTKSTWRPLGSPAPSPQTTRRPLRFHLPSCLFRPSGPKTRPGTSPKASHRSTFRSTGDPPFCPLPSGNTYPSPP